MQPNPVLERNVSVIPEIPEFVEDARPTILKRQVGIQENPAQGPRKIARIAQTATLKCL